MFVKLLTIPVLSGLFLTGCGKVEVREYTEVVQLPERPDLQRQAPVVDPMRAAPLSVAPIPENMPADHPALPADISRATAPSAPSAPPMMPPASSGPNSMLGREGEVPPPPKATDIVWELPEGWTERAGSGMRIAEFLPDSDVADGLVTLIALGPGAGGLEANTTRWRGQVGLPPRGESETLQVEGKQQFTFVTFARESREAGLPLTTAAAIYSLEDRTLFLKFTGPT
ncbi:MAG: hypothetical protein PF795_06710, partial [Kiritimatiellae bacterium]|nr:hypothetical protein [Kiritimatiellia bacterium]